LTETNARLDREATEAKAALEAVRRDAQLRSTADQSVNKILTAEKVLLRFAKNVFFFV
jgi:hypothetical protein